MPCLRASIEGVIQKVGLCILQSMSVAGHRVVYHSPVARQEPQPSVIFTASPDAEFSSFTPETIPHKDAKLAIYFETQEMMEETLILLRFNCPDSECDYIGSGWNDLKLHVRGVHGKVLWCFVSLPPITVNQPISQ